MKSLVTASVLALALLVSTAQAQVDIIRDISVEVSLGDPQGNEFVQLRSVPNLQNQVQLGVDTASVFYHGEVVDSLIPEFQPGTPFTVSGNGSINPNPGSTGSFDTEIVALSLTSSLGGGPFPIQFVGARNPLNFTLAPGPLPPAGQTGLFITSHRVTPEPGSLVLLGLGAATLLSSRRRKAASA
ncbi:MAG: hypothetical protein CMJ18_13090 [Phycisphaeraceae bacterium]|nr:hypothetical protein [Phycisphaeraceae bacterium]